MWPALANQKAPIASVFKTAEACQQTSMKLLFSWFNATGQGLMVNFLLFKFWEPRPTYIMAEKVVSLSEL